MTQYRKENEVSDQVTPLVQTENLQIGPLLPYGLVRIT